MFLLRTCRFFVDLELRYSFCHDPPQPAGPTTFHSNFDAVRDAARENWFRPGLPAEGEVHCDLGFYFHRLAVQQVGPVTPLTHRINGRRNKHGMATDRMHTFD